MGRAEAAVADPRGRVHLPGREQLAESAADGETGYQGKAMRTARDNTMGMHKKYGVHIVAPCAMDATLKIDMGCKSLSALGILAKCYDQTCVEVTSISRPLDLMCRFACKIRMRLE